MEQGHGADSVTCCQRLGTTVPTRSPFTRIVATGWYGGPTHGIAQCGVCAREYLFSLCAWDANADARILRLRTVSKGTLVSLTERFRCAGAPTWPLWVPEVRESGACATLITDAVRDAEAIAGEEGLLVESTAIQDEIRSARSIDASALLDGLPTNVGEHASFDQWVAVLRRSKSC